MVGGRSNAGKSTVAAALAERSGGVHRSTDSLGRHPGRPWGAVPAHVVAHYETQTDEATFAAVLAHQRNMQPAIAVLVRRHVEDQGLPPLVLEGSAIMPEETLPLISEDVRAVWLTAGDDFMRRRIEAESGYAAAGAQAAFLIERFIERNRRLNMRLGADATRLRLPLVATDGGTVADVASACLAAAGSQD